MQYISIYTHIYTYASSPSLANLYIYMHIHICLHTYTYAYVYLHSYIYIYIYRCVGHARANLVGCRFQRNRVHLAADATVVLDVRFFPFHFFLDRIFPALSLAVDSYIISIYVFPVTFGFGPVSVLLYL